MIETNNQERSKLVLGSHCCAVFWLFR